MGQLLSTDSGLVAGHSAHSGSRVLRQQISVLSLAHAALLLSSVGHDLLLVVRVPGSIGVAHIDSFPFKSLKFLDGLVMRHGNLKLLPV